MKIWKTLLALLLPLAVAINTAAALDEKGGVEEESFSGTLSSVDFDNMEIVVNTQVPGILGAQARDFPLKVDKDTEMTICVKTLAGCHDLKGENAMGLLWSIDNTGISDYRTDVAATRDPDSERVTHVKVQYSDLEAGKGQEG